MAWKFARFLAPVRLDCTLYDAFESGRLHPEDVLADKDQINKVLDAMDIIQDLEAAMLDKNLIEEC
jgi:hypothetical protein